MTGEVEPSRVRLDQLREFVQTEQGKHTGFWITISNVYNSFTDESRLMITKVEEQYIP